MIDVYITIVGIDVQTTFTPRYYGYVKQSPETATKQVMTCTCT